MKCALNNLKLKFYIASAEIDFSRSMIVGANATGKSM